MTRTAPQPSDAQPAPEPPGGVTPVVGQQSTVPIEQLRLYYRNARQGRVEDIAESLKELEQFQALTVNIGTHTGRPWEVLAGNHTMRAAKTVGWTDIDVRWVDVDNRKAAKINAVANRLAQLGSMDNRQLLDNLLEFGDDLSATGYDPAYLEHLKHLLESKDYDTDRAGEYERGARMKPVRRTASIDMILSMSGIGSQAIAGYALGWNPGVISSATQAAALYVKRFPRGKPVMFMDNDWHGYDHSLHLAEIAKFRPKYATVRDIVTSEQAEQFGVAYYTIEETIAMAADVAQHTENVILIPKFDCLDQLPRHVAGKRVVLGYSVESSYGGTDIPPSRFAGWPVHLLGGPWKKQRALLNILGDDVVSLDNNNLLMIGMFGQINLPDGSTKNILETIPFEAKRVGGSAMTFAVLSSLAFIMHAIITDYGVAVETTADVELSAAAKEGTEHDH